jgi:hypothetical protein
MIICPHCKAKKSAKHKFWNDVSIQQHIRTKHPGASFTPEYYNIKEVLNHQETVADEPDGAYWAMRLEGLE